MEPWSLPKARPISCNDSPAFQRRHRSVLCSPESLSRFPCVINTTFRKMIYIRWCCIDRLRPPRFAGTTIQNLELVGSITSELPTIRELSNESRVFYEQVTEVKICLCPRHPIYLQLSPVYRQAMEMTEYGKHGKPQCWLPALPTLFRKSR
jgi:hypothetical protein